MTYLIHQMKALEDASWLKVSHPEYLDFNSDEDDLLVDKTSDVSYNELASNHDSQDETNDNVVGF